MKHNYHAKNESSYSSSVHLKICKTWELLNVVVGFGCGVDMGIYYVDILVFSDIGSIPNKQLDQVSIIS